MGKGGGGGPGSFSRDYIMRGSGGSDFKGGGRGRRSRCRGGGIVETGEKNGSEGGEQCGRN